MFELIDEIEEGIKRFLTKKGFGWLLFFVTIGFSIGKWLLSIVIKNESKKLEDTPQRAMPKDLKRDLKKERVSLDAMDETLPTEELQPSKTKSNFSLSSVLKNKNFAWSLLGLSMVLSVIENFFKIDILVGGWHIVMYLLLILPLLYLLVKSKLENEYLPLFLPFLFVFIGDMFYYNNQMVQQVVPIVFFILLITLYLTSMQKVNALYQTVLPTFNAPFEETFFMKTFFQNLWRVKSDKKVFKRVVLALAITMPFLAVFLTLLLSADSNFSNLFQHLLDFNINFKYEYLLTVPAYFFLFLFLFIYAFSNHAERLEVNKNKPFDLLIVGIFLGMINLLFFTFIALQIPFLFSENYVPKEISIANFAREGFFQLMMVMGIVLTIFIYIMRRFKGEAILTFLLFGLLLATIAMGIVSLKKMHLYQELKGATVLRYYVEWFDYFLLFVLALGIIFLFRKIKFEKLLSTIVFLGMVAFTTIVSLNIDAIVTKHNLEKFKNHPELLDIKALEKLSIDALPVVLKSNIDYPTKKWFIEERRAGCKDFSHYHLGYCAKLELIKNEN